MTGPPKLLELPLLKQLSQPMKILVEMEMKKVRVRMTTKPQTKQEGTEATELCNGTAEETLSGYIGPESGNESQCSVVRTVRISGIQRQDNEVRKFVLTFKLPFDDSTIKAIGTSITEAIKSANEDSGGNGNEESKSEDDDQTSNQTGKELPNGAAEETRLDTLDQSLGMKSNAVLSGQ
eukprot:CAMPEP_0202476700 /NCGR_PEP_ID=MMETSP1360-20130828/93558_1 /ASSEMBLY_ACC=CAM_ASM_000848 /TAXON_ID=515479 /ORGANISM="Licmophora paradoxa, Strain CCMP2313" /LENGTH=178 /DNA_ID=CAMNT_0049103915 /DNA_START=307 /DNA_END=843 /DNA_ORIENTATION=+